MYMVYFYGQIHDLSKRIIGGKPLITQPAEPPGQ
jgi:hypothetical protein